MFVDKVVVQVKAGDGGDGRVNFRHEKYVNKGGPDGGDGGRGGNVILQADANRNTLIDFRFKQELVAESGGPGSKQKMHGKNGEDLIVLVPVGTMVFDGEELIGDLTKVGQQLVVARGGQGGFGNAHFISSVRQAPKVAEVGEKGEAHELTMELKLLADVGLIGLPNAGKSTFLSIVSNARPEIADYPFTTLIPNLGVAKIDEDSLLIADIPGLIEGASQGKGLGDEFLRHVERTGVLLHLVDIYNEDVPGAYTTIRHELEEYSSELIERPEIVLLTKIEGFPKDDVKAKRVALEKVTTKGTPVLAISAAAHMGVEQALRLAREAVVQARKDSLIESDETDEDAIPVIELPQKIRQDAWRVSRVDENTFRVVGRKIESFASRTNFENEHGVDRLRDIMRKMGIMRELEHQGIKHEDRILIGRIDLYTLEY
jgi:GTPase